jgi:hypothetical protein
LHDETHARTHTQRVEKWEMDAYNLASLIIQIVSMKQLYLINHLHITLTSTIICIFSSISYSSNSQIYLKLGNLFTIFSPSKFEFFNNIILKKLNPFILWYLITWPWSYIIQEIINIHHSLRLSASNSNGPVWSTPSTGSNGKSMLL